MKYITSFFICCIAIIPMLPNPELQGKNSIELVYSGDRTSQIPIVIFYLKGTENSKYDSTYSKKYEVPGRMFSQFQKIIIDNSKVDGDTLLISPFDFIINCEGQSKTISISDLATIRQIFSKIIDKFQGGENAEKVKKTMNSILSHLSYQYRRVGVKN